jgi:hypothetical protein
VAALHAKRARDLALALGAADGELLHDLPETLLGRRA